MRSWIRAHVRSPPNLFGQLGARGFTGRLNGVKNAAAVQLGDTAADVVNTLDQANEFSLTGVPALAVSEQERYAYQLTGLAIAEAMETDVGVRNAIRDCT